MSGSTAKYALKLASVLKGAAPFNVGNVSDTYRGAILLSDGMVANAVIKDLPPKELANELLASALAQSLGMPIPDSYLAIVRNSEVPAKKGPKTAHGEPLVFASADVNTPNFGFRFQRSDPIQKFSLLRDIIDWSKLGDLYAFDTWIANIDRHRGNVIFGGKDKIWIIDHGHSFTGPMWVASGLNASGDYRNRLSEWLTGYLQPGDKARHVALASSFSASIGALVVSELIDASGIRPYLTLDEQVALESFLEKRKPEVHSKAAKALGALV